MFEEEREAEGSSKKHILEKIQSCIPSLWIGPRGLVILWLTGGLDTGRQVVWILNILSLALQGVTRRLPGGLMYIQALAQDWEFQVQVPRLVKARTEWFLLTLTYLTLVI